MFIIDNKDSWHKSLWTTILVSFTATFSFCKVEDWSTDRALYMAIGMSCISISCHRFLALVK